MFSKISIPHTFQVLFVTVALIFSVLIPTTIAHAATFTVDSILDTADDNVGNGICHTAGGVCTLRAAIEEANSLAGADTITFSLSGTIVLGSLLPVGTDAAGLILDGTDQSITISGAGLYRVLFVNPGTSLTLNNLTIANGLISGSFGGGIFNNGGGLTITNSAILNNLSDSGAGGIYNGSGTLSITNSTISGNSTSNGTGGGVRIGGGTVTITNSIISGNTANNGTGGAVSNCAACILNVDRSTFSNNSADFGGAIRNDGTLNVTNSTFSTNASASGGGGTGGAIDNEASAVISNSTFSGNTSDEYGGAIFSSNTATLLAVTNSTFSANSAASLGGGIFNMTGSNFNLKNTIIANSASGMDCFNLNGDVIGTNINNLIETNGPSGGMCGTPSLSSDPNLGPLASNGGSTQTFALLAGSPAIDTGDDTTCAAVPVGNTSQNGLTRLQGSHCDIGAYEAPSSLTFTATAANDGSILESTETSGAGSGMDSASTKLNLGDDAFNKQYRAILSFDTSSLPDTAVITSAKLMFKYAGKTGTLPFSTHGNLIADVRKGPLSNNAALQLGDFKAAASKKSVLSYTNSMVSNWFSSSFAPANFQYINLTNVTQFRLRFATDDNNDFGADLLKIYSGNAGASSRPKLIVEYYVP